MIFRLQRNDRKFLNLFIQHITIISYKVEIKYVKQIQQIVTLIKKPKNMITKLKKINFSRPPKFFKKSGTVRKMGISKFAKNDENWFMALLLNDVHFINFDLGIVPVTQLRFILLILRIKIIS